MTPSSQAQGARVAILLCTYNGEKYLGAQLESIERQQHRNWVLWISDDGSCDGTLALLQAFMRRHPCGRVNLKEGPRQGFAANYMSLVQCDDIDADFIAFCDQDDIWLPHRLSDAVAGLAAIPDGTAALYCGRTEYIDARDRPLGRSRIPDSFGLETALAQNVCAGNTMLLNRQARSLLLRVSPGHTVAHDWLSYLVVSASGGVVLFDPCIAVQYRQHKGNSLGENRSFKARLNRIKRLCMGDLRVWTSANLAALGQVKEFITPRNRDVLRHFAAARTGAPWQKLANLNASGVRREGAIQNLAFRGAFLAGLV